MGERCMAYLSLFVVVAMGGCDGRGPATPAPPITVPRELLAAQTFVPDVRDTDPFQPPYCLIYTNGDRVKVDLPYRLRIRRVRMPEDARTVIFVERFGSPRFCFVDTANPARRHVKVISAEGRSDRAVVTEALADRLELPSQTVNLVLFVLAVLAFVTCGVLLQQFYVEGGEPYAYVMSVSVALFIVGCIEGRGGWPLWLGCLAYFGIAGQAVVRMAMGEDTLVAVTDPDKSGASIYGGQVHSTIVGRVKTLTAWGHWSYWGSQIVFATLLSAYFVWGFPYPID